LQTLLLPLVIVKGQVETMSTARSTGVTLGRARCGGE
jgi:hypothetical protein